eukprot:GEMP01008310.1.p1 GENE.GEMP01008310.1~~GEMP01008310.1.p1  ORF type:complete len:603 (+),score=107.56 GEMP01008310.1:52-1860(+)
MTRQEPQYQQPDRHDPDSNRNGRWIYEKRIGSGAYGDTWKVYDRTTETVVCLKVLKSAKEKRPAWVTKVAGFQMHQEATVSINILHNPAHPKYDADKAALLVRYLEDHTRYRNYTRAETAARMDPSYHWDRYDVADTAEYVVMEYLDYSTVRELLKQERFPRKLIYNVACKTVQAIEYLQSFDPPIIHRDIRVHNIMAKGTHVKLIDFGLVIRCRPSSDVNPNLCLYVKCGKEQYWAPPEVQDAWNRDVPIVFNYAFPTHSFDIYSLGVLCVEMLSDPTTFYTNSSARQVSVSAAAADGWKSLGLASGTLEAMIGADPQRRPTPRVVYEQLTSNVGQKIAPLGEMTNIIFRNSAVAKFVNLAREVCVLQENPNAQKIRRNTFRKLLTAIIPIVKGETRRMHDCMDYLLNLVCVDDCVEESTVYQNYLLINQFIDYALCTLAKKSTAAPTEAKREENSKLCRIFIEAMRSTHPGRCTAFIEALWATHACRLVEPRATQCQAEILESRIKIFPELARFVPSNTKIPVAVPCSQVWDKTKKYVHRTKRVLSLVSTTDDDDSPEDEKGVEELRPVTRRAVKDRGKRHKGNARTPLCATTEEALRGR